MVGSLDDLPLARYLRIGEPKLLLRPWFVPEETTGRGVTVNAKTENASLLTRIANARRERQHATDEQLSELLDAADIFIHHAKKWLERVNETALPVGEAMADPALSKAHSLLWLSNTVLQGLFTLAESYRAGILYPGGWIERKMLEARINAGFIAYEPTGLAGQRWLYYGLYHLAKAEGNAEEESALASELRSKFPHERPWKAMEWAKKVNHDGRTKALSSLPARAKYLEKIWPTPTGLPDYARKVRQEVHQYELAMIGMDNLVVHASVTGDEDGPNPIRALYAATQAACDVLPLLSEAEGINLTTVMKSAHAKFVNTMLELLTGAGTR